MHLQAQSNHRVQSSEQVMSPNDKTQSFFMWLFSSLKNKNIA